MDNTINFASDFELFNNNNLGSVRAMVDEIGQIWFVAKDLCEVLTIANSRDAISRLDDDEKMTVGLADNHSGKRGGAQYLSIINESGMYSLVLSSKKPQAKEFKRWLTHEVIPSIREHGGYIYGQEALPKKEQEDLLTKIEELTCSVQKYKRRWHELNIDKKHLQTVKKELKTTLVHYKKEIDALNDYANNQENLFDRVMNDYKKALEQIENSHTTIKEYIKKQENITSKPSKWMVDKNGLVYFPEVASAVLEHNPFQYKNNVQEELPEEPDFD